jgi:hypothetical protein
MGIMKNLDELIRETNEKLEAIKAYDTLEDDAVLRLINKHQIVYFQDLLLKLMGIKVDVAELELYFKNM